MTDRSLSPKQQFDDAVGYLLSRTPLRPSVGVVLGSGLSSVVDLVPDPEIIPFSDIPHLPSPTVPGHPGALVLGTVGGRGVAIMQGRLHYHEGLTMWQVTLPIRLLHALGVSSLIFTNAAGGLNPQFGEGDLMLISDHICIPSLAGINPLRGLDFASFGSPFVGMQQPYDPQLASLAWEVARSLDIQLYSGVYAMVGGPSYETAAELGLLRDLGADAVGMSTAPETIVAVQLRMKVLAISCIANHPAAEGEATLSHEHVLARTRAATPKVARLIRHIVAALP